MSSKMKKLVEASSARRRKALQALTETMKRLRKQQEEPGESAQASHRRRPGRQPRAAGLLSLLGF
jgi:hypothetical protein